jgi:purine-binding chemotaxis protein CheW
MNETTTATIDLKQPPDLSDLDEEPVETRKYLVFVSDDLKLGVDADYLVEIITNQKITYLPMMPDFVRGIINLRGQIIPIVDIRARLGKPTKQDSLVVVLNMEVGQMGIVVDAVDQMIDIPTDSILPMPAHSTQQLVSGMCSLPDGSGTMMVLDCDQLLHNG